MTLKILFVSMSERAHQSGSYKSRGTQMGEAFKKLGALIKHDFFPNVTVDVANENDVLVFVKCRPPEGYRAKVNALLLMDIVDNMDLLNKGCFDLADVVIFPNHYSHMLYKHECSRSACVVHHFDPDFAVPTSKKLQQPRFIYVGHQAYLPGHAHRNPDIYKVCNHYEQVPSIISQYNVHLNLRKPGTQDFLMKPNSKVSFAASCPGTVLLTTRENSTTQFASMKEYPYYLDGDSQGHLKAGMELIKATYGGPLWNKALDCLKGVYRETTLETVAFQYMKVIKESIGSRAPTFPKK